MYTYIFATKDKLATKIATKMDDVDLSDYTDYIVIESEEDIAYPYLKGKTNKLSDAGNPPSWAHEIEGGKWVLSDEGKANLITTAKKQIERAQNADLAANHLDTETMAALREQISEAELMGEDVTALNAVRKERILLKRAIEAHYTAEVARAESFDFETGAFEVATYKVGGDDVQA